MKPSLIQVQCSHCKTKHTIPFDYFHYRMPKQYWCDSLCYWMANYEEEEQDKIMEQNKLVDILLTNQIKEKYEQT